MSAQKKGNSWLTISLIFLTPVLFIFFLGSQMAYGQVSRQFERYQNIREASGLAELEALPAGQVVMVRGQIAEAVERPDSELLIFQVRPADGREVRFQEEFPLVFPEFVMALPDGTLTIQPSLTRDRVIYDELHRVADGEYELTGFNPGDTVTVQGQWQPVAGAVPALVGVTGITGGDRRSFMADWEQNMRQVKLARNMLGLLSVVGLVVLIVRLRRSRRTEPQEEENAWPNQTTTTAPTT
jgi:hypothetical protein